MNYLEVVTLADELRQNRINLDRVAILVTRDEWDKMVDDFCDGYRHVIDIDDSAKELAKSIGHGVIYGVTVVVDPKEKK